MVPLSLPFGDSLVPLSLPSGDSLVPLSLPFANSMLPLSFPFGDTPLQRLTLCLRLLQACLLAAEPYELYMSCTLRTDAVVGQSY